MFLCSLCSLIDLTGDTHILITSTELDYYEQFLWTREKDLKKQKEVCAI
jgi:hypothetical protein